MTPKPQILIYTDCYVYGGSERLMSFLWTNPVLKQNYDITLVYRKHKIYEQGLEKEYGNIKGLDFLKSVSILSNYILFHNLLTKRWPGFIKNILKLPFYLFDALGFYFIYNMVTLSLVLKKIKPDIIHINNGGYPGAKSCKTMVRVARILGFNHIVYQVNNMALPRKNIFGKMSDKFINNNVDYFITASSQAKNKLQSERKFPPNKVLQLPNSVIEENPTLDREQLLNMMSVKNSDFVITVVAFLSKRKGHIYLLQALNIIKQAHPEIYNNIKVLFVGNGEEEFNLKDYTNQNALDKNIIFLGYQSRSIDFINACDLFVLPSISDEDMPLVILTAMSKGKTILATDFAGIREEIENGVSGVLVPADTDRLAQNLSIEILRLYGDRDNNYGKQALIRFNKLFSTEVYGNAIKNLYNSLLTKNKL
jgi:glycosyltransferase involved in cell wall biosynthesis